MRVIHYTLYVMYICCMYIYIRVQSPHTYVFICIADTDNKLGCGDTGESLNYNALDKRCKRTCNEITKCVSKEYMIRARMAKGDIANLVAAATSFSQVIQSRRSPRDHKTDDRALKRRLIASRPLGKHIVGKLCFPCSLAIRFFEIYGIEIGGT